MNLRENRRLCGRGKSFITGVAFVCEAKAAVTALLLDREYKVKKEAAIFFRDILLGTSRSVRFVVNGFASKIARKYILSMYAAFQAACMACIHGVVGMPIGIDVLFQRYQYQHTYQKSTRQVDDDYHGP